jgi:hypothetical protein
MPVYTPLNLVFGDTLTSARAATLESQYKLARGRARPLGGIPDVGVKSASYVDVPGVIVVPLDDGTTAQVHAMGFVSGGATGWIRLWDMTAAAVVTGSEISFTSATPTLQTTPNLELNAGSNFKVQVKVSDAAQNVVVYGAALVTQ